MKCSDVNVSTDAFIKLITSSFTVSNYRSVKDINQSYTWRAKNLARVYKDPLDLKMLFEQDAIKFIGFLINRQVENFAGCRLIRLKVIDDTIITVKVPLDFHYAYELLMLLNNDTSGDYNNYYDDDDRQDKVKLRMLYKCKCNGIGTSQALQLRIFESMVQILNDEYPNDIVYSNMNKLCRIVKSHIDDTFMSFRNSSVILSSVNAITLRYLSSNTVDYDNDIIRCFTAPIVNYDYFVISKILETIVAISKEVINETGQRISYIISEFMKRRNLNMDKHLLALIGSLVDDFRTITIQHESGDTIIERIGSRVHVNTSIDVIDNNIPEAEVGDAAPSPVITTADTREEHSQEHNVGQSTPEVKTLEDGSRLVKQVICGVQVWVPEEHTRVHSGATPVNNVATNVIEDMSERAELAVEEDDNNEDREDEDEEPLSDEDRDEDEEELEFDTNFDDDDDEDEDGEYEESEEPDNRDEEEANGGENSVEGSQHFITTSDGGNYVTRIVNGRVVVTRA